MEITLARPRGSSAKPEPQGLYVELSEELFTDLEAFARANYKAPRIEVIREALRQHMEGRLRNEPILRERFVKAREEVRKELREPIRLVDKGPGSSPSDSPNKGGER